MKYPKNICPPDDELWLLTSAMCDGTITPEQKSRLESLLHGSEEARLFYSAYMDLHGQLLWHYRDSKVRLPKPSGSDHTVRIRLHWVAAMLMFALMGLVATATALLRGPQPHPIGHITSSVDSRWENPKSAEVGTLIYPNEDLWLKQGVAEVTLNSGTVIVLRQQAKMRLESVNVLNLRQGGVCVYCPADASRLTVKTPGGEFSGSGVEFDVCVKPDDVTEVNVLDGGVLAEGKKRFNAGQAFQLGPNLLQEIKPGAGEVDKPSNGGSGQLQIADFSGQSLDDSHWRTITPFPESRVELAQDSVKLVNGSHLVTAKEFDPLMGGRLSITGIIRFPTFGPHERFHELDIVTRGDGRMREGAFPQAANGIVYTLSTKVPHAGSLAGSNAQIWVAGRQFRISRPTVIGRLEFKHDASYRFEIIDDGLQLSVSLSQADDPANRVTVTATVIKDTSDSNWIAFYGGMQYQGRKSISELSALRIELGGP